MSAPFISGFLAPSTHNINITFKSNEKLHFGCVAELRKLKKVTNQVRYRGLSASIKIMKGVRYRLGSIKFESKTREFLNVEDEGYLYITNQRIGFIGKGKQFSLTFNKIIAFELTVNGMYIFKEGKESPYIVGVEDYDVPLSMLSLILNPE